MAATGPGARGERCALAIVGVAACAMALGLIFVYSTSATRSIASGGGVDLRHPVVIQTLYVVLSLASILLLARVPYTRLAAASPWIYAAAVVLLALLLVPGVARPIHGAVRWYRFGPLSFQPSELAKIALVLFLGWWLSRSSSPLRSFLGGFLPALAAVTLVVGLIAVQPDFGTSLFAAAVGGFLLLVGGARIVHLAPVAVLGGVPFAVFMFQRFEHVRERLAGFREPLAHYNTQHSLLALGSGGLAGAGLGNGRQKLGYLPEHRSDFIFSIIGEEIGFIGAAGVVLLYLAFLWTGASIALRARDTLGFHLAAGVTLLVGLQALIHVAVATASVPTKGIPLPFVSVGGSNLLCLSLGVGILASVARHGIHPPGRRTVARTGDES